MIVLIIFENVFSSFKNWLLSAADEISDELGKQELDMLNEYTAASSSRLWHVTVQVVKNGSRVSTFITRKIKRNNYICRCVPTYRVKISDSKTLNYASAY